MTWDELPERFRSKVRVAGDDECWIWTGNLSFHGGYGHYGHPQAGKDIRAHRLVFKWLVGPIPAGMCVLHVCDRPPCVNPAHLRLGTQLENIQDRERKARTAKGETIRTGKLQRNQVEMIRRIYHEMEIEHAPIARIYGVHPVTIFDIVHRRTWKHV